MINSERVRFGLQHSEDVAAAKAAAAQAAAEGGRGQGGRGSQRLQAGGRHGRRPRSRRRRS